MVGSSVEDRTSKNHWVLYPAEKYTYNHFSQRGYRSKKLNMNVLRYDIGSYKHTDTAWIQHIIVGPAQACPNYIIITSHDKASFS